MTFFIKNLTIYLLILIYFITACTKNSEKAQLPPSGEMPKAVSVDKIPEADTSNPVQPQNNVTPNAAINSTPAQTAENSSDARVSGNVVPVRRSQLSFKVGGHILSSKVREGEIVKHGQLLAVLDDADYVLRAHMASLSADQANIVYTQAQKDYEREAQLRTENATSVISFERISNALANSRIALKLSQLGNEQAKKNLQDTKLLAPYQGVLFKQIKFDGEYVAPGAPVFEMYDSEGLEVNLKVPEGFINQMRIDKEVEVFFPSLGKKTKIRISRITPLVQESSRSFDVFGKFVERAFHAVPGQFVDAKF